MPAEPVNGEKCNPDCNLECSPTCHQECSECKSRVKTWIENIVSKEAKNYCTIYDLQIDEPPQPFEYNQKALCKLIPGVTEENLSTICAQYTNEYPRDVLKVDLSAILLRRFIHNCA